MFLSLRVWKRVGNEEGMKENEGAVLGRMGEKK
jgi:hypothetical protein